MPGRQYNLTTFVLPDRHPRRLWMLSRDPAISLGFRDSYVLFLRNPELKKIRATEADRQHMDSIGVLPSSLRKRDVFLVLARALYKKFGHRVVCNGRLRRDDYHESKMPPPTVEELDQESRREREFEVAKKFDVYQLIPRLALKRQMVRQREESIPGPKRLHQKALSAQEFNSILKRERKSRFFVVEPHTHIEVTKVPISTVKQHKDVQYPVAVMTGQHYDIYPL